MEIANWKPTCHVCGGAYDSWDLSTCESCGLKFCWQCGEDGQCRNCAEFLPHPDEARIPYPEDDDDDE